MKALVVYYSLTGKTEAAAQAIADYLKVKIIKIEEIGFRRGIWGFIKSGFEAVTGSCSELKPMDFDLSEYDTILIGSPVWAGSPTPAVNAFISEAELKRKKVIIFFTQFSKKNERAVQLLREKIKRKGGNVVSSFSVAAKALSKDQIAQEARKYVKELL